MPQTHSDLRVQINPAWLDRASYVEFLNQGFPGQWNERAYEWYVARGFNARRSDLLVRTDGDRVLSGMTLCYRQIAVGNAPPLEVAVLSAGTTLAAERGRGHYPVMLQAALARCREQACVAAVGFVTHNNVSGTGLLRLGARAIPSFYIVSPKCLRPSHAPALGLRLSACLGPPHRHRAPISAPRLFARHSSQVVSGSAAADAHFHYGCEQDWQQQFLLRPHAVHILRLAHDSYAVLEAAHDTDRLQLLVCPDHKRCSNMAALAAASAAAGRKFFMYTLAPAEAAAARRAGLQIRNGYLMLQPTGLETEGWKRLSGALWRVQSGDRM
jgi:hypothetical protein